MLVAESESEYGTSKANARCIVWVNLETLVNIIICRESKSRAVVFPWCLPAQLLWLCKAMQAAARPFLQPELPENELFCYFL